MAWYGIALHCAWWEQTYRGNRGTYQAGKRWEQRDVLGREETRAEGRTRPGRGGSEGTIDILNKDCRRSCSATFIQSCSFFSSRFFSRAANLSSGVNDIHTTRQVCRPAEKMAGKKTTRQKNLLVTFMLPTDMYLHFTRSNVWANGNN